ncbi:hypothetical protein O9K51_09038 [Purpureocillium lavendulum]|uniref:Uncharacterized protein n=1 Tax=Purpureocillium lavendulum TaxID=1247861 RepID=A0AB34FJ59_9HYPO|nr:hypothetical protein O9K51_09038 [Purpureocillium lavendulum]
MLPKGDPMATPAPVADTPHVSWRLSGRVPSDDDVQAMDEPKTGGFKSSRKKHQEPEDGCEKVQQSMSNRTEMADDLA